MKMIKKMAGAVVGLGLLLAGNAHAVLLGVGASAPDFQFLGSTVNYTYNAIDDIGTLSITQATGASQFLDQNNVIHNNNPFDGDDANPLNLDMDLTITATVNGLGQLIAGSVDIFGIMNFGSGFNISTPTTLVQANLDEIGFDASTGAIDFLGFITGGHPTVTALFSDVGVVANAAGFTSWTSDFSTTSALVDVTTPPVPVSVPAPLMMLALGLLFLRRKAG